MAENETFGRAIRRFRKGKNLTQSELAHRVAARLQQYDRRGFDVTYLSKIENDRFPPPSSQAITELAAELDANCDELFALAGRTPADVARELKKSQGARVFFRSAVKRSLSEEDWVELLKKLESMKAARIAGGPPD
jgi:HTH-type transcriptional regulator, competence development regulator